MALTPSAAARWFFPTPGGPRNNTFVFAIRSVRVGTFDEQHWRSDHRPVLVKLDLPSDTALVVAQLAAAHQVGTQKLENGREPA